MTTRKPARKHPTLCGLHQLIVGHPNHPQGVSPVLRLLFAEPWREHKTWPHLSLDVSDAPTERPELACAARPAILPAAEDVAPDPLLVTP